MAFGFFTQNLDTMGKTTKKKNLLDLDNLNQINKVQMGEFIGGNENLNDNKPLLGRFAAITSSSHIFLGNNKRGCTADVMPLLSYLIH